MDIATLLFSALAGRSSSEAVLTRLAGHAPDRDRPAVTTVCLASALFDRCVYVTSGVGPQAVTAWLLRAAATPFDLLA